MAQHPFSAGAKPLPPAAVLTSKNPLPFAATLRDGLLPPFEEDPLASSSASSSSSSLGRLSFGRTSSERFTSCSTEARVGDELAVDIRGLTLAYDHHTGPPRLVVGNAALRQPAVEAHPALFKVGSDEWVEREVARCVDGAERYVDLSNKGLEELSTKISDLQHLVTLSSVSPAYTSKANPPRFPPSASRSNTPTSPHLRSPTTPIRDDVDTRLSPFSASTRTFARYASAPATNTPGSSRGPSTAARPLATAVAHHRVMLGSPVSADQSRQGGTEGRDTWATRSDGAREDFGGFDPPGSPVPPNVDEQPSQRLPAAARSSQPSPSLAPPRPVLGRGLPESSPRAFTRTASGSMTPVGRGRWSGTGKGEVFLTLAGNSLSVLPSALFQVTNLVGLSLRQNKLISLPAAIGELKNLKDLNVSSNRITSFPPTILDLDLDSFLCTSNPLIPCPVNIDSKSVPSGRLLGPLQVNSDVFPSLRAMCISHLLSPRRSDDLPPLLSKIDWEPTPGSKEPHGLQDATTLHSHQRHLSLEECQRITACLRTAYQASSSSRQFVDGIPNPAYSPSARHSLGKTSVAMPPDDASQNPYYTSCPSPHHVLEAQSTEGSNGQGVTRRIYLHQPAEERLEWVKIKGADSLIPIKWQGCQRGCLDFLEEAEEVAEDGFDIDVIAEDWD